MAYRNGTSAAETAEGSAMAGLGTPQTAPANGNFGEKESSFGRYTSLAFVYNQDAARLVMLYRSPTTGETEYQIPSEVALRRYEEAAGRPEPSSKPARTTPHGEDGEGTGAGTPGSGGSATTTAGTVTAAGVVASSGSFGPGTGESGGGSATAAGPSGSSGPAASSNAGRLDVVV